MKKLLDTSDYQFDKTEVIELAVIIDFMAVIHKTGYERHPKINKDRLKKSMKFYSCAK